MKKYIRFLTVSVVLILALLSLFGCSKKEERMDRSTFEVAVDITDDNLTVSHVYNYDGIIGEEVARIVDGKAYVDFTLEGEWLTIKADNQFFTIVEISKHYDDFSVQDGKYVAAALTVKDEMGLASYLSNVELEFDDENRLTRLYYEYENGAALDKYTYEFSSYGTTVAP